MPVAIIPVPVAVISVVVVSARVRMPMPPVPVIVLLSGVEPAVIPVRVPGVSLGPIIVIRAVFIAIPTVVIAMVRIVIPHAAAGPGYAGKQSQCKDKRSSGLTKSSHGLLDADREKKYAPRSPEIACQAKPPIRRGVHHRFAETIR